MLIHTNGNYSVEKLADKHYVVFYEDSNEVKIVKSFKQEVSAVKFCEKQA